ncbi:MAG: ATPase, T2SS/T4P/T4SS family, partial [Acidobacteriota bacterium]
RGTPIEAAWKRAETLSGFSESELAGHVAAEFGLKLADLGHVPSRVVKLVPEKSARSYCVFPLRENDRELVVACSDPTNLETEEVLRFASGRQPVFEIAPPTRIQKVIDTVYSPDSLVETLLENIDARVKVRTMAEPSPPDLERTAGNGEPVIRLANLILLEATTLHASDIHLEPGRTTGKVRLRVDGVLRLHMQMPMPAFHRVVSRIKVMGNMDITDRLRPQDGRTSIQIKDKSYDLRISTVPTRDAEKAVIRILYTDTAMALEDLGMPAADLERFRRLLSHREGLILVTGPTGSGKTTTLYAALQELTTGDTNVMSVEDPIEYELEGVTQIQVEPLRGISFASALRAILRQDPDVLLIGEIRDLETAEIAVQASQTGHLVLATLHANDALGALTRLQDLGLTPASIGSGVCGILAQRLLRVVCPDCRSQVEDVFSDDEARLAEAYQVTQGFRTTGCDKCGQSGYQGRKAVTETVMMTPRLKDLIGQGADPSILREEALLGGMKSIGQAALDLVKAGSTTLEELERVVGEKIDPVSIKSGDEGHVFMVDDDPIVRQLARKLLEKNGFSVSEAIDGDTALEVLDSGESFDLMILDVNMPTLNGDEVLRRVRRSPRTAGLPIIVLTGSEDAATEVMVMEQGADDYIRKPIEPLRFLARIKAVMRRAGVN